MEMIRKIINEVQKNKLKDDMTPEQKKLMVEEIFRQLVQLDDAEEVKKDEPTDATEVKPETKPV
jgi:hypothetical protein